MSQKQSRGRPSIASVSDRVDSLEADFRTIHAKTDTEIEGLKVTVTKLNQDNLLEVQDTTEMLTKAIEDQGKDLRGVIDTEIGTLDSIFKTKTCEISEALEKNKEDLSTGLRAIEDRMSVLEKEQQDSLEELKDRMEKVYAKMTRAEEYVDRHLIDMQYDLDAQEYRVCKEEATNKRINTIASAISGFAVGICVVVLCIMASWVM